MQFPTAVVLNLAVCTPLSTELHCPHRYSSRSIISTPPPHCLPIFSTTKKKNQQQHHQQQQKKNPPSPAAKYVDPSSSSSSPTTPPPPSSSLPSLSPTTSSPPPPSSSSPSSSSYKPHATRKSLFLLDVSPLCYRGKKPSPSALIGWLKPLFSHVTAAAPIIAVMDGERGNVYRRCLLSTYKANRNAFVPLSSSRNRQTWKGDDADLREAFPYIKAFMRECHIPVVSMEDAEADDIVASLTEQAVQKGMRVTIASPDKDFKQLLCEKVQIVAPLPDLERWSFYTHKDYFDQHNCDPDIELSLHLLWQACENLIARVQVTMHGLVKAGSLLGDKADSIPGLADFAPGFGRKTASKLLKKHGSLDSLLHAASIRTVGKPYVQEALTEHASILRRNLEVLRLLRDLPICLKEEWCLARDSSNDVEAFSKLEQQLKVLQTQRTLKDGVKTRSFSDQKYVKRLEIKNYQ